LPWSELFLTPPPLRLDALVTRVSGDRVGLDFTISSPYAASNIRARSSRPLLNRMEDRKRAHYVAAVASLVPATSFVPVAVLTTELLGPAARAAIRTQAGAYASRRGISLATAEHRLTNLVTFTVIRLVAYHVLIRRPGHLAIDPELGLN